MASLANLIEVYRQRMETCLRWISEERKRLVVLFVFASFLFAVIGALVGFNVMYIFDAIDGRLAEWMK